MGRIQSHNHLLFFHSTSNTLFETVSGGSVSEMYKYSKAFSGHLFAKTLALKLHLEGSLRG